MDEYQPSPIAKLAMAFKRIRRWEKRLNKALDDYNDPRGRATWEGLGGASAEKSLREAEAEALELLRECVGNSETHHE